MVERLRIEASSTPQKSIVVPHPDTYLHNIQVISPCDYVIVRTYYVCVFVFIRLSVYQVYSLTNYPGWVQYTQWELFSFCHCIFGKAPYQIHLCFCSFFSPAQVNSVRSTYRVPRVYVGLIRNGMRFPLHFLWKVCIFQRQKNARPLVRIHTIHTIHTIG